MSKILIFSGTGDGRELAEILAGSGHEIIVCVATEYGEQLMPRNKNIKVHCGRMDEAHMYSFFASCNMEYVIDATHPYAKVVSENIRRVCQNRNYKYYRLLRDSVDYTYNEDIVEVMDIYEAAKYLSSKEGNIFVSTGSKELPQFIENIDNKERIFARVLPSVSVLEEITALGISGKQIIAMQGPFSEAMNYEMFVSTNTKYLLTKDSGSTGGFAEKLNAAKRANMQVVLIKRPAEEGYSKSELLHKFNVKENQLNTEDKANIEDKAAAENVLSAKNNSTAKYRKKITLAGIGMGDKKNMTCEVVEAIKKADLLIGADRMLKAALEINKNAKTFSEYRSEEIAELVYKYEYENIVIVMSGDVGFYSGAKKLYKALEAKNINDINVLPGISTPVYMASKLNLSWEDMLLLSMHGRDCNLTDIVKYNKKVFVLSGGSESVSKICKTLTDNSLGYVKAYVGTNLSYPDETIISKTVSELAEYDKEGVSSIILINDKAQKRAVTHGICDDEFLRDKVPMTKEEVRCVSISKLHLDEESVVYDIGAGSGSVSIECALRSTKGKVYAIEKKDEAAELINKNCIKFNVENVEIIKAYAPDIKEDINEKMLMPTHCFIGGSGGNLSEIIDWVVSKNKNVRFVINAIALETVSEIMNELKKRNIENAEIVSLNVAKSKKVGNYNMMFGNNPVYVVSFSIN